MEWRLVHENSSYEVSSEGKVRRITDHKLRARWQVGRELSPQVQGHGLGHAYLRVKLDGKYIPIARLVAEAFIMPRPVGFVVNHKDGVKSNNCLANLEWVTLTENAQHALRTGLRDPIKWSGERHGMSKLTEDAVRDIRSTPVGRTGRPTGCGGSTLALAVKYNVTADLIRKVRRRVIWKHIE